MKTFMKAMILSAALLFTAPSFAQRVHIYVAPPALKAEVAPDRPSPDAVWVPGYYKYDPAINDYTWVAGSWQTPPYPGAVWVTPEYRHHGKEYFFVAGKWRKVKIHNDDEK